MAHVYWLHFPEHEDFLTQGYIGAASNIQARLRSHKHKFKAIWDKIVVKILVEADIDYCFDLEKKIRPTRNIGWNKAAGGFRNNGMAGEENPNFEQFGAKAPNFIGSYITPAGIFDSSSEAAKIYNTFVSTISRRCKGRTVNGKYLPPQEGWGFIRKAG